MAKGATATRARTARGDAAGEPEMVQLLTPDGERIKLARDTHGNEYTVDFTDEEYRRSTATWSWSGSWTPRRRPAASG